MSVRHFYPAFRVFIFGVEVTDDVLSITVNLHDGRSPNTAEVELVNAGAATEFEQIQRDHATRVAGLPERYIVTHEDILAMHSALDMSSVWPEDQRLATVDALQPVSLYRTETQALIYDSTENVAKRVTADLLDQVRVNLDRTVADPVKRRILKTKVGAVSDVGQFNYKGIKTNGDFSIFDALKITGQASRFPLQVGDCVFHSSDPIRIFARAPEPDGSQPWYYLFTGFVTDWTDVVNDNNERVVRIRAEDPTRVLRYARTTSAPGQIDINQQRQRSDDVAFNFFQNALVDMTLPEFLFEVIFGNSNPEADEDRTYQRVVTGTRIGVNSQLGVNTPVSSDGANAFKLNGSKLMILDVGTSEQPATETTAAELYPPEQHERIIDVRFRQRRVEQHTDTVASLGEYHKLVSDHRVTTNDLVDLADEGLDPLTITASFGFAVGTTDIDVEDVITFIGEHPELYPVDGGRVFILAPSALGTADREVLLKQLIAPAMETGWATRLKLIYDLCERIEFSFYATPKGDLVCEMPLFTFDPYDFENIYTRQKPDKYPEVWKLRDDDVVGWEHTFSDEHIRTAMSCDPALFKSNPIGSDVSWTSVGKAAVVVKLESLFPAFGVRQEKCDSRGLVEDEAGAEAYAALMLSKWNSDARSARIRAIPNIKIATPNRPLLFAPRDFVCTVRKVTHTVRWGSDMETTYDVNYIRGWSGQFEENETIKVDGVDVPRQVYEPIGGLASQALNYALMYRRRGQTVENTARDPGVSDT